MTKLLYYRSYKNNPDNKVLCTHKSFKEEVRFILTDYVKKGLLRIKDFEDCESVCIIRQWHYVDWYEVYSILQKNGYILTNSVEKQYKYYVMEHNERVQRERKEQAECKAQVKEEAKYEIVYWCGKYDCHTTLALCKECWYRINHLNLCQPVTLKLKNKGE